MNQLAEMVIDTLKRDPYDTQLKKLRQLKFELIGSSEKKEKYFNQGLIEVLFQLIGAVEDEKLLIEIITLINCYFFDFPKAAECFKFFSNRFIQMHFFLETNKDGSSQFIDIVLRVLKNALQARIIKPKDFENHKIIQDLSLLMNSRARVSIISRLIAFLCEDQIFREQIAENKSIIDTILLQITQNQLIISDECLENCLSGLAQASYKNKNNCQIIYNYPLAIQYLTKSLRHPDNAIKIKAARIFTNINKFTRLPKEQQQQFKWVIIQMSSLLSFSQNDTRLAVEICRIIKSITSDSKDRKHLQKIASDIQAIEKISELFLTTQETPEPEPLAFDSSIYRLTQVLLKTLAALASDEESCRKKLGENKKFLETLLKVLKSSHSDLKQAACSCFVSLSRSEKILKSIILEAGDFNKELIKIVTESDDNPKLQLTACKAICNLCLDFQKSLSSDSTLMKKLVQLTYSKNQELKFAATFSIKNLLFKNTKDIRFNVMKEFTMERLLELLEDENHKVLDQTLMIVRNLLYHTESDIQQVINDCGEKLLSKLEAFLAHEDLKLVVQALWILCNIASGNQKHKKIVLEDRFILKALELMKTNDNKKIKIVVANLIINLAFKDPQSQSDSKARKAILDMKLIEVFQPMLENERDSEVKGFIERALKYLN